MSALPPPSYGAGASGYLAPVPVRSGWREQMRVWWRELDHTLLLLITLLMALGVVAVLAASPASADQLSTSSVRLDPFLFFKRHVVWLAAGLAGMIAVSFLSRDRARQLGIVAALIMFGFLMLVPLIGFERNGAVRWINLGMSLQPSEFLKPGFAIALAWILSWRIRDPHLPVFWLVTGITLACASLLMLQPNLGETLLFLGTWFVLIFLSGVSMWKIGGIIAAGPAALGVIYLTYENGRNRIDAFLQGGTAFDQVDLANRTMLNGGWSGTGLWLGNRKFDLPEAHTDYIFSVIGEEFGLLACALVGILYLAVVTRVLVRLAGEENMFALLAGTGLIAQFGGQALINMAVNLELSPATGTTLPLISYGGSSMLAVCFTLGLLLAITRRNPFLERDVPGLKSLFERRGASEREESAA
ncbi:MAG: putative peptidoglycan glycosyltransferase FtsW [Pseudomonadota bacterium]